MIVIEPVPVHKAAMLTRAAARWTRITDSPLGFDLIAPASATTASTKAGPAIAAWAWRRQV